MMASIDSSASGLPPTGRPLPRPERPGPALPLLQAAWDRMFRSLPTLEAGHSPFRPITVPSPVSPRVLRLPVHTRVLPSQNWSGASIVPHGDQRPGGRHIALAFGRWAVPALSVPALPDQQVKPGRYVCSTWLGFDGARQYFDSSLPQIGLEHWLTVAEDGSAVQTGDVFFQWWSRFAGKHQAPSYRSTTLTMTPGTEVMAMLWALDATTVMGLVRNFHLTEVPVGGIWQSPAVTLEDGSTQQPHISGATAEWVVERPSTPCGLEPFPDYGGVDFSECVAGTAPKPGAAIDAEQALAGERLLRIYEVPSDAPQRTRVISHARRASVTAVSVRYGAVGSS